MTDAGTQPHPDDLVPRHDCPIGGRSGFVIVDDDRQVHYLEWGRRDAPAVVCLHGGGQTAYMWEELGAALRDRYHVLAPDLPNHGDSDPMADDGWGRQLLADSVPPVLDEFGIDHAVFVGASLGGITSITLAAAQPSRFAGIVLVDVGHRLEAEGVHRIVDFMRAHESFASLDEAAAFIGEYLPYRKSFRPESLTRNLRQRADGRWVWKHGLGRRWQRNYDEQPDLLQQAQPAEALLEGIDDDVRALQVPVLVLRGRQSDLLSSDGAEELLQLLPDGRLATVERAGHLAVGDNPNSTVNLIGGFLREIGW